MDLCPAFPGRLLDLFVERKVRERTDGDEDQIHAPAQDRNRHGPHGLDRSRLHDVVRLERKQLFHVRTDAAADLGRSRFAGSAGAAGDTNQLIIREQTVFPSVRDDVAQKSAADDAKFRFHIHKLLFLPKTAVILPSIPCRPRKEKLFALFFREKVC